MATQETELERIKKEYADLQKKIQSQNAPSRPQARSTAVRGRRPAIWMSLLLTSGAFPFIAIPWYFNGMLSVEAPSVIWYFLYREEFPRSLVEMFTVTGWIMVILTTLLELVGFWHALTSRPLPRLILQATIVFGTYDLATTAIGLYGRWLPSSLGSWAVWAIGSIFITYAVETILSLFWREL